MIFSSLFSNEKSRLIVGNVILEEYVSNPLVSVGFWTSLGREYQIDGGKIFRCSLKAENWSFYYIHSTNFEAS